MKHLALLVLLLTLCSTFAAETVQIIKQPGDYLLGGKEKIKIFERDGNLTIVRTQLGGGITFPVIAGWKVYSDAGSVAWAYDGDKEIRRIEFNPSGISAQTGRFFPSLWGEAPKRLLEAN